MESTKPSKKGNPIDWDEDDEYAYQLLKKQETTNTKAMGTVLTNQAYMEKVEDVIKRLVPALPCKKMIITGSVALYKYGLVDNISKDIDIILVEPTEETKATALRYMESFPTSKKPHPGSSLLAMFLFEGHKIDIFVEQDEPTLSIDGLNYATIRHIVAVKNKYNRMKDWLQLRTIAYRFFDPVKFQAYLNTNPDPTLNSEDYSL